MEGLNKSPNCKDKFPANKIFLHDLKCENDSSTRVKHAFTNKKAYKNDKNTNLNNIKTHLKKKKYRHKNNKFQFSIMFLS